MIIVNLKEKMAKAAVAIAVFCFCSFTAAAAVEVVSAVPVKGSQMVTGASRSVVDHYFSAISSGTASSIFTVNASYVEVNLGYEESLKNYYGSNWQLDVVYRISLFDGTSTTPVVHTHTATITYDPASPYQDKFIRRYEGYYKAYVTIQSVTRTGSLPAAPSPLPNDIWLNLNVGVDRDYKLSATAAPKVGYQSFADNTFELKWNYVLGAESYDVEWLLVDIGTQSFSTGYAFDFANATRINTSFQSYKFNLVYPRGILLFRVRPVATDPATGFRIEGLWSYVPSPGDNTNSVPTITLLGTAFQQKYNYAGFESALNWSYSASFAEKGKRNESIMFMDGLGREREKVMVDESDERPLVSQTIYDFNGRPAIQVLPSPVAWNGIVFYDNLSKDATNAIYSSSNFDTDSKITTPDPMSSTYSTGAAYYYSTADATETGINAAYTPDAEGYPYVRTVYKNDGTDRVSMVSGTGKEYFNGAGGSMQHQVKVAYGTVPSQEELDRLFGNEVGPVRQYSKKVVTDPNQQATSYYYDSEGRLIATALSSALPDSVSTKNLDDIDTKPASGTGVTTDLTHDNQYLTADDELIVNKTFVVASAGNYTFDYWLENAQYCDSCMDDPGTETVEGCVDCKYDIYLSLVDEWGTVIDTFARYNVSLVASSGSPVEFSEYLDPGTYTIYKKLSLNTTSAAAYVDAFEAGQFCYSPDYTTADPCNPDCATTCHEHYTFINDSGDTVYLHDDGSIAAIALAAGGYDPAYGGSDSVTAVLALISACESDCGGTAPVIKTECEKRLDELTADMSPGGQYFDNLPSVGTVGYDMNDWINTHITLSTFESQVGCTGCSSWADVRSNWTDTWADVSVTYHPEYCIYEYYCDISCGQNNRVTPQDVADYIALQNGSNPDYYTGTGTVNNTEPLWNPAGNASHTDTTLANAYQYEPFNTPSTSNIDPTWICLDTVQTLVQNALLNFLPTNSSPSSTDYMSIWYVLADPRGIAGAHGGHTSGIDTNVVNFFDDLFGDGGTAPYIIGTGTGHISRYQYFLNTYNFFKNLYMYQNYEACTTCLSKGDNCSEGFMDANLEGRNADGFIVHYPANPIFHNWPLTSMSTSAIVSASGTSVCEEFADQWMDSLQLCTGTLSTTNYNEIRQYFIEICTNGRSAAYPTGSDDVSTGTGTAVSEAGYTHTGPYSTFDDVIDAYGYASCTTTVVHPDPSAVLTNYSQGSCDCEGFTTWLSINGYPASDPTPTNLVNILSDLEATVLLSTETGVDTSDIHHWYTECANSASGHPSHSTLAGYDYPDQFTCPGSLDELLPNPDSLASNCNTAVQDLADLVAYNQYLSVLANAGIAYGAHYTSSCMNVGAREHFNLSYTINEYNYTLYYYDQAGNLVKTVPPAGVHPLDATATTTVQQHRSDPVTYPTYVWPSHKLITLNRYSSVQQKTLQVTPDGGSTNYFYDELSRLVATRDAHENALSPKRSRFVKFDELGRPFHTGEAESSTSLTAAIAGNQASFFSWINSATRRESSQTTYDSYLNTTTNGYFGAGGQQNLRNRISTVTYEEKDDNSSATYLYACHYSYDIHGNIQTYIQETVPLAGIGQSLKQTDYQYEIASGKITQVSYQAGQYDEFYHRYYYDADNRLKEVHTSRDGVIYEPDADYFYATHGALVRTELGEKQVQAMDNTYTLQGWLKGVNSNTLYDTRDPGQDSHVAGTGENINEYGALDAVGYTLGYYQYDYKPVVSPADNFEADISGNSLFTRAKSNLFNGTITHMVTAVNGLSTQASVYEYDQLYRLKAAQRNADLNATTNTWNTYAYDADYREGFKYDGNGNLTYLLRNGVAADSTMDSLRYHYNLDGSGNLLNNKLDYVHDGHTACDYGDNDVKNQSSGNYTYDENGRVTKAVTDYITDLIWYSYNKPRYEIKDKGVNMKCDGSAELGQSDVEYQYNALGQRMCKIEKPHNLGGGGLEAQKDWIYTWYVYDAGGNQVSSYNQSYIDNGSGSYTTTYAQNEAEIMGMRRLGLMPWSDRTHDINFTASTTTDTINISGGMVIEDILTGMSWGTLPTYTEDHLESGTTYKYTRELGDKQYELTNHLGNVLAIISDRKIEHTSGTGTDYYTADRGDYNDYYAYGGNMPQRHGDLSYKYGFDGMEKDKLTTGQQQGYTSHFREYDPLIGRWLSVDPKMDAGETPYSNNYNNPINHIDPRGDKGMWFKGMAAAVGLNLAKQLPMILLELAEHGEEVSFKSVVGEIDLLQLVFSGAQGAEKGHIEDKLEFAKETGADEKAVKEIEESNIFETGKPLWFAMKAADAFIDINIRFKSSENSGGISIVTPISKSGGRGFFQGKDKKWSKFGGEVVAGILEYGLTHPDLGNLPANKAEKYKDPTKSFMASLYTEAGVSLAADLVGNIFSLGFHDILGEKDGGEEESSTEISKAEGVANKVEEQEGKYREAIQDEMNKVKIARDKALFRR